MVPEMLQQLADNPVFTDLSKDELQFFSAIIKREDFNEGDIIIDVNKKPNSMYFIERGSFILALLNNKYKRLNPGELIGEIGVINGDFRSGRVTASESSTVISICGTKLFMEEFIPSSVALKIVRALSKRITSYLRSNEQISTSEIIQKGESESVEFKSTLRWNLFSRKKDKAIEKAILKALTSFMNSNGGLLIVGVDDEGNILGLEHDQFESHDKLLLHITNIIKERIGPLHLKYLNFTIEKISDKDILRIDCHPADVPAYFKDENSDHLFIRYGPSTTDLRLSKVYDYITERFTKN